MVPLYEVPVIPTLPVDQNAVTVSFPVLLLNPFALPHNQSTTALGANDSFFPPTVGEPSESPVPGEEECTTMYPLGTQVLI